MNIERPLNLFVIFVVLTTLLTACVKMDEYPTMLNVDEFRRSFFHDGEGFVQTSFDESLIKSAVIVLAELSGITETSEGYVIYDFTPIEEIKNLYEDERFLVYEPLLADGSYLYAEDTAYVLILSRLTDIYYQEPVFHNFNNGIIAVSEGNLTSARIHSGSMDLMKTYGFKNYDDIKNYIHKIREDNQVIKEGSYAFSGRYIVSDSMEDIIDGASTIIEGEITEILYQNRLFAECTVKRTKSYKGDVSDHIIVSLPVYLNPLVGENYLMCLFKDGNYTLASSLGLAQKGDWIYERFVAELVAQEPYEEANEEEILLPLPDKRLYIMDEFFKPYFDLNKDVVGWFSIEDTAIDYPVLKGPEKAYNFKHDINGDKGVKGSIILDYRCDIKNIQRNTMIYGHNMKDGSMFHEIVNYKNYEFFKAHPIISFKSLYDELFFEVFSVHVVDGGYVSVIDYPLSDDVEYAAFLKDITDRSMFISDINVTLEDQVLTLITCSYEFDGARTVVHARLMD